MTNQNRIKNGEAGFSLIEVMITAMVLAVGLVAILASTTAMFQQQKMQEYEVVSVTYMDNLLSYLQEEAFLTDDPTDIENVVFENAAGLDVSLFTDEDNMVLMSGDGLGLQGNNTPVSVFMERHTADDVNPAEIEVTLSFRTPQNRIITFSAKRMVTAGINP